MIQHMSTPTMTNRVDLPPKAPKMPVANGSQGKPSLPYPSSDVLVDRLRNYNVKSPDALRHRSRRYRYLYISCEAKYACVRFTPVVKQTVA